jgi:tRNA (cytidine/uridine-2'-O-)-methyltransferase
MFHIVLYEPEIPPNTGNIIRLCANTGSSLHLIHPLGFELENRKLRRAGLDYREWARVMEHSTLNSFLNAVEPLRLWAVSTRGSQSYHALQYRQGDAFLLGPETRGLPQNVLQDARLAGVIRLPMVAYSRSLNLANTAAVVLYEAWRQNSFAGAPESE